VPDAMQLCRHAANCTIDRCGGQPYDESQGKIMTTRTRTTHKLGGTGFQEKRRGRRMNSRVLVRLDWEDTGGVKHSAQAHTRIVNPYGCLVVLPDEFALGQPIQLTNLAAQQTNPATVVWKGNEQPDGWEYGIEMTNPEMDFWGLDL